MERVNQRTNHLLGSNIKKLREEKDQTKYSKSEL